MRYTNLADKGAIFNDDSPAAGIHNRGVLRAVLEDRWQALRIYTPEPIFIELDQNAPQGGTDQTNGPWLLLKWDTELIGDDPEISRFRVGSQNALLAIQGIRLQHPLNFRTDRVCIENLRPVGAVQPPDTDGIRVPGKGGNPQGRHFVELERTKIRGFSRGFCADSGPVNALNYLTAEVKHCDIIGDKSAISFFNDPAGGGAKSLHISERTRLGTTKSPWSTHVVYIAATANLRVSHAEFHSWREGKFGIQHWGSGLPGQVPNYASVSDTVFESSGDGYTMITTPLAPTTLTNVTWENRTGIVARNRLMASGLVARPKPAMAGTISLVTAYPDAASVTIKGIDVDLSYVGAAGASVTVFDPQTSSGAWNIETANIRSDAPCGGTIFGAPESGDVRLHARGVTVNAYHVPDQDYAAGVRSDLRLTICAQGTWDLADVTYRGDVAHDRGVITVAKPNLKRVRCSDVTIEALRGNAVWADQSNKIEGDVNIVSGALVIAPATLQHLQLPPATQATAGLVPDSNGKVSVPTYSSMFLVGGDVNSVLINGNVDDTWAYVGTPLKFVSDGTLKFTQNAGSNLSPAQSAINGPVPFGAIVRFTLNEMGTWVQS
jgi:hypothetical protein